MVGAERKELRRDGGERERLRERESCQMISVINRALSEAQPTELAIYMSQYIYPTLFFSEFMLDF